MTDTPQSDRAASEPVDLILRGERVAFTGTLASMTHRQAAELVEQHGGQSVSHVSQQTTLLVVGEEGWPLEPNGQPSVKLVQAQAFQQRGQALRILSESEWLTALKLEPTVNRQQLYTPAILSQMLNVSVHAIRRWERLGLIRAVKRVLRLPYFDFSEVTAARRLAELVAAGTSVDDLAASFQRLQAVLPDIQRPLAQLELLAHGRRAVYRDATGWVEPETGQRVFEFDKPAANEDGPATLPMTAEPPEDRARWTADDWFKEGCTLSEDGELSAAIDAFRLALVERPTDPDLHFHLADALYRQGNRAGAIERYYSAVEHDRDFIEAWTQLGCVSAEVGDDATAREALETALDRHPEYPDAHFHLAQLLDRIGDEAAARQHWQTYLLYDARGPWAELARQRLSSEK